MKVLASYVAIVLMSLLSGSLCLDRLQGNKGIAFMAIAHCWVGWLIGAACFCGRRVGGFSISFDWRGLFVLHAIILIVVEVGVFTWQRL